MDPSLIKSVVDRAERERVQCAQGCATDESILCHARRAIESNTEEAKYYSSLLAMLEQKEDDVRLAAHLGESLIKENAKLRAASRERESLLERCATAEASLMSSRDEVRSLERRLDISTAKLDEADEVVQTLQTEVNTLQLHLQNQNQLEASKLNPGLASPVLEEDGTDGAVTPAQGNAPSWSDMEELGGVAPEAEAYEKLKEDLETLTSKDRASQEEKAGLRQKVEELMSSRRSTVAQLDGIRKQLRDSQAEKAKVANELKEAMDIIREASSNQEDRSLRIHRDGASIDREVKQTEGAEVDIYFFHFHMLAMSIKAKTVHAHPDMPKELLEEMNKLNLKQLYNEVLEHGVPPHDWYQYIYDLYASVQLQALMRGNTVNRVFSAGPCTPSSTGKKPFSTIQRKSSFTRFIGAMSDRLLSSPSTKLHPQTPSSPF